MSPLRFAAYTSIALAAFACPVQAFEYAFAKDGMIADIELNLWPGDFLKPGEGTVFSTLGMQGGQTFQLSTRPLSFFADLYGGQVQHFTNAGYTHDWLCYTAGDQRLWLFTNGGPDGTPRGLVDWLVIETADPAFDAGYGCTEQPLAMLAPGPKVPSVGMTRAEIGKLYGAALPADGRYVTLFEMSDEAPYTTSNVTLRFEGDVVTGVSLAQGSEE